MMTTKWMITDREKVILCVKHPGCGLLTWSNGDRQCYFCGKEKYKGTNVTAEIRSQA